MIKEKKNSIIAIMFVTIPLLVTYFFFNYLNYTTTDPDYHFSYVAVSVMISIFVSVIAYLEYKRSKIHNLYFLSIGFMGLSILYLFFGLIFPNLSLSAIFAFENANVNKNMIVMLGDLSRFWLAVFMFFPGKYASKYIEEKYQSKIIIAIGVVMIISVLFNIFNPQIPPAFINESGTYSYFGIIVIMMTLLFFGISLSKYYYSYKAKPNLTILSFIIGIILLMETSIVFMIAELWTPTWWLAHSIFLLSYIVIGAGILYSYKGKNKIEYIDVLGQLKNYMNLLKNKTEELDILAQYDALTGLINRHYLFDNVNKSIVKAKVENNKFGIMLINLNGLKHINHVYGHLIGDDLLRVVSNKIDQSTKKSDLTSRVGGNEFVVLVNNINHNQLEVIAQRIINNLQDPFHVDGNDCQVSSNIGISIFPDDGQTLDDLLKKCDMALYFVKNEGKNNYKFASNLRK